MTSNIQRLGETLNARMKKVSNAAVPITVELGTINSNLSLTTDSLQATIPKGSYMVDIRLAAESYRTEKTKHTHTGADHSHTGGEHDHRLPEEFRELEGGDRVLVVWCGHEPVVVAIVKSS